MTLKLHRPGPLAVAEVAARTGAAVGTVVRWITRGLATRAGVHGGDLLKLPATRVPGPNRPYAIDPAALDAFLAVRDRVEAERAAAYPGGVIASPGHAPHAKLGRAATTIVARQSCPDDCAFRGAGCYAEHTAALLPWRRATAGAPDASPLALAAAEAAAVDGLPADRDLRLHLAGDSKTPEGTRLIAAGDGRYVARGRVPAGKVRPGRRPTALRWRRPWVWAYTHAWRSVARPDWGPVAVLASCETAADVRVANARGYAAALAVPAFEAERAYPVGGVKVLPCPAQTRGVVCTDCRLCFNDGRLLRAGLAIGFALHGGGRNKAAAALRRVSLPTVAAA